MSKEIYSVKILQKEITFNTREKTVNVYGEQDFFKKGYMYANNETYVWDTDLDECSKGHLKEIITTEAKIYEPRNEILLDMLMITNSEKNVTYGLEVKDMESICDVYLNPTQSSSIFLNILGKIIIQNL